MILQALYEYYQRKASAPDNSIAPEGWEWKEIPYTILISKEGKFVAIEDNQEMDGKRKRSKKFLVPQSVKRTVGKAANLLWDNIEYALGANPRNRNDVNERFKLFINRIEKEIDTDKFYSVKALLKFLNSNPVNMIESSGYTELWQKMLEENPFIVFKLDGEAHNCICDDIKGKVDFSSSSSEIGVCLITGTTNIRVARLHPSIKGVRGANTQGAALLSFNLPAFNSYNKKQNYNAPVSKSAAFAYTTALNLLLDKDSKNRITIADSTILFWSEIKSEKHNNKEINPEEIFPWLISGFNKNDDDPDRGIEVIKKLYDAIYNSKLPIERDGRFYILGLAPNAARIAVRFWRVVTVDEFATHIKQHFDDFKINHDPKEQEYLSLYQILASTALSYDMENVPPNLAGKVIESIIDGTPYPNTLLQQCIRRIRAEQNVNRTRAGILKAYLNRFNRIYNKSEREITMSLDTQNKNIGYRLGRLFAVLEKIQEEANPGINTTIKDRFYGAASSSPTAVFSQLLKLKNHHTPKLQQGEKIYFEKLITEIMSEIKSFPGNLSLNDQAYFGIGYYHQRQDFFTIKSDKSDNNNQQ